MQKITCEELRRIIDYDATTGDLVDKGVRPFGRKGRVLGTHDSDGYLHMKIYQVMYKAHRLAWLHTYGKWPVSMIDHINGDRADNRIENLREANHRTNGQNMRKAMVNNRSTGLLGASYRKREGFFVSSIKVDDSILYLGRFNSAEEAHQAYITAKRKYHEGCTI